MRALVSIVMNTTPTTSTTVAPRLTADEVAQYRNDGYFVFNKPVLPADRFQSLKNCFEGILANLPSDERPEAMDVPHFMHPELLKYAFDENILALVEPIVGPDIALFSTHFI
jgi:hypothetical protein